MPTSIGRDTVRRLVAEEQAQVVEVLGRPEYEWTHLADAIHVPLKSRFRDLAEQRLRRNLPVVVYCNDYQ